MRGGVNTAMSFVNGDFVNRRVRQAVAERRPCYSAICALEPAALNAVHNRAIRSQPQIAWCAWLNADGIGGNIGQSAVGWGPEATTARSTVNVCADVEAGVSGIRYIGICGVNRDPGNDRIGSTTRRTSGRMPADG